MSLKGFLDNNLFNNSSYIFNLLNNMSLAIEEEAELLNKKNIYETPEENPHQNPNQIVT